MHIPLAGGAHPGGPHPLGGRRGGRWAWDLMHICVIVIILITTIASCLLPLSVRSTVRYGTVRHGTHALYKRMACMARTARTACRAHSCARSHEQHTQRAQCRTQKIKGMSETYTGYDYIGHNYKGHNYVGHEQMGHNYMRAVSQT